LAGSILGSVIAGVIVNKNDALPLYKNEIVQIFLLIALVQIVFVVYTVLTVRETPLHEHAQFELASVIKTFCVVFILFQNQYGSLIAAAFFGIGYGAYTRVDWALTTDALSLTDEAGKFMGIWSAMSTLPQVIGIAIGAVILQPLGFSLGRASSSSLKMWSFQFPRSRL
jgi:hypothetical protein